MVTLNKGICYGALWILGVLFIAYYNGVNPAKELILILDAETVSGAVLSASHETREDDEGYESESFEAEYTYQTNGQTFTATSVRDFSEIFSEDDEKPIPIQVEYWPSRPSVSRIKGTGSQTLPWWLFSVTFQLVILAALSLPGFAMLWTGYREAIGKPLPMKTSPYGY